MLIQSIMIIVIRGYFSCFMPEFTQICNLVQTSQEKEEWRHPVMIGWGRIMFCGGDPTLRKGQNDHEGVWGIKHYRLTTALIPWSSVPFEGEKVKEGEWIFAFSFSYASSTSNRQCIILISLIYTCFDLRGNWWIISVLISNIQLFFIGFSPPLSSKKGSESTYSA